MNLSSSQGNVWLNSIQTCLISTIFYYHYSFNLFDDHFVNTSVAICFAIFNRASDQSLFGFVKVMWVEFHLCHCLINLYT
jgi:hypothetical protein